MIELSPGRGIYVYESLLTKAAAKTSPRSTALFLLSCFYRHEELMGKNLEETNGKTALHNNITESMVSDI